MDNVVDKIFALSGKEDLTPLELFLEKNAETISKSAHSLSMPIQALAADMKKHAMGLVWLAAARSNDSEDRPMEGTVAFFEAFVTSGGYNQIKGYRSTLKRWRLLIHNYTAILRVRNSFRQGLHFLGIANTLCRPTEFDLTPAAPDFLLLALKAGLTHAALPMLTSPILSINPEATGADATDCMLYYYYGGLAFTVQKRWENAKRSLESALMVPALATSQIMVEAYKLYLLVGVIHHGRHWPLPQHVSASVERSLTHLTSEYSEFAKACESGDHLRMHQVLEENSKFFQSEMLRGLVQQAQLSIVKRRIRELTRVYVTVSVNQLAATVGVSEVEVQSVLLTMVEEGSLNATITRVGGMVSFHDQESETVEAAEARISAMSALSQRIENLDEAVSLSIPYVTEKLRAMPNYHQLLTEFEQKRKATRGVSGLMQDLLRGSL